MDNDHDYHAADGTTGKLATLDDVLGALSDLSRRVADLETKPAGAAPVSGDIGHEVERLRAVVEPFFGSELIAYDQRAKADADAKAAADANTGAGTAGQ